MVTVDLYMENRGKTPKEQSDWYGYVFEFKGRKMRDTYECVRATAHGRDLIMFLGALRQVKDCRLTVHTESTYLIGGYSRIKGYQENGWITARGEPVKYSGMWQQVAGEAQGKEIRFIFGRHKYTGELIEEIGRRKAREKKSNSGSREKNS